MTNAQPTSLKPCPFCGSPDPQPIRETPSAYTIVVCQECGAQGPSAKTPEEAIEAWKQRKNK